MAFMTQFHIPRQTVFALLLSSCGLLLIGFESLFATARGGEWIGDLLFLGAGLPAGLSPGALDRIRGFRSR